MFILSEGDGSEEGIGSEKTAINSCFAEYEGGIRGGDDVVMAA